MAFCHFVERLQDVNAILHKLLANILIKAATFVVSNVARILRVLNLRAGHESIGWEIPGGHRDVANESKASGRFALMSY